MTIRVIHDEFVRGGILKKKTVSLKIKENTSSRLRFLIFLELGGMLPATAPPPSPPPLQDRKEQSLVYTSGKIESLSRVLYFIILHGQFLLNPIWEKLWLALGGKIKNMQTMVRK